MIERDSNRAWMCRCEEVHAHEVRQAIDEGARSLNDVKRRTRLGMGACQGVYCVTAVTSMLSDIAGVPADTLVPITPRPPARLIQLGLIADMDFMRDDDIKDIGDPMSN